MISPQRGRRTSKLHRVLCSQGHTARLNKVGNKLHPPPPLLLIATGPVIREVHVSGLLASKQLEAGNRVENSCESFILANSQYA